jgi:hypothetical protein
MALVFNMRTGQWGKYALTIAAASNYYAAGVIYGVDGGAGTDLGDLYSTYDGLPTDISYDSPYWSSNTALNGVIKTDDILYTLSGVSGESTFTLNTIGDDEQFTTVTRVRPRFLTAPDSSTLEYSYDNSYGDAFLAKNTYNLTNYKYDLIFDARWHEFKFNFSGNMEMTGVVVTLLTSGTQ